MNIKRSLSLGRGLGEGIRQANTLTRIFTAAHRSQKPGPLPPIQAAFHPFAGLNHTIRRRDGRITARVSDVLQDAPPDVLAALAAMLIARLDRRRADTTLHARYRNYILQDTVQERARAARIQHGRPLFADAAGRHVNLDARFDRLNRKWFDGTLSKPTLAWSRRPSSRILGRYDSDRHAIVISRLFDSEAIPSYVIDYVLFHEMLHVKHTPRRRHANLVIHTPEFETEARAFPFHAAANAWLDANLSRNT